MVSARGSGCSLTSARTQSCGAEARRVIASASSLRLRRVTASASIYLGHGHSRSRHMDACADESLTPV
eukprot:117277-Lingulodinium_polyedra.AAC.1